MTVFALLADKMFFNVCFDILYIQEYQQVKKEWFQKDFRQSSQQKEFISRQKLCRKIIST